MFIKVLINYTLINKPNRSGRVTAFVSCLTATTAGFVGLVLGFIITAVESLRS